MTAVKPPPTAVGDGDVSSPTVNVARPRRAGVLSHVLLAFLAVLWLIPLVWTLYTSLRPESDTNAHG